MFNTTTGVDDQFLTRMMTTLTKIMQDELFETFHFIRGCSDAEYKRTPLLAHWKDLEDCAELSRDCDLYLKLENMQVTGAYRVLFSCVDAVYPQHHLVISYAH